MDDTGAADVGLLLRRAAGCTGAPPAEHIAALFVDLRGAPRIDVVLPGAALVLHPAVGEGEGAGDALDSGRLADGLDGQHELHGRVAGVALPEPDPVAALPAARVEAHAGVRGPADQPGAVLRQHEAHLRRLLVGRAVAEGDVAAVDGLAAAHAEALGRGGRPADDTGAEPGDRKLHVAARLVAVPELDPGILVVPGGVGVDAEALALEGCPLHNPRVGRQYGCGGEGRGSRGSRRLRRGRRVLLDAESPTGALERVVRGPRDRSPRGQAEEVVARRVAPAEGVPVDRQVIVADLGVKVHLERVVPHHVVARYQQGAGLVRPVVPRVVGARRAAGFVIHQAVACLDEPARVALWRTGQLRQGVGRHGGGLGHLEIAPGALEADVAGTGAAVHAPLPWCP
mmetsp:Transcript_70273/g.206109  ORF Transcript_70273/g.206109 Transcript_70273/m.206109 type:complete len:399 (-) Transcript_70273:2130-3326(-)